MNMKYINKRYNPVYILIIISVLCGVINNFSGLLSENIKYLFYSLSILTGYSSIFIYLLFKKTINKNASFLIIWLFLVFYMVFIGLIRSSFYTDSFDIGIFLATDLRHVMYFAIGIILADKSYEFFHFKLVKYLSYLAIVFFIYAISVYSFNFSQVQFGTRIGIWELPYFLWWLSIGLYPFMYSYARIFSKSKLAGYGILLSYVTLGTLFLKRSVFVNFILIIVIVEIIGYIKYKKKFKLSKIFATFFGFAFVIVAVLYVPYLNVTLTNLLDRFVNNGSIFEYDRSDEVKAYFQIAKFDEILTGQGLGHYIEINFLINALHIGFFDAIYKGGILYLALNLYIFYKTIKAVFNIKKLDKMLLVHLVVTIMYIFNLFYEMSFSYTIVILGFSTSIAKIINLESEIRKCTYASQRDQFMIK